MLMRRRQRRRRKRQIQLTEVLYQEPFAEKLKRSEATCLLRSEAKGLSPFLVFFWEAIAIQVGGHCEHQAPRS